MSLRVTVAVVVLAAVTALPASSATPPEEKHYKVGGPDGWRVPPPDVKEKYYANWASGITFYVGDSVEFVYKNDSVIKVDKAGYYHCTGTAPTAGAAPRDGRKIFHLDAPGYAYFASADLDRCKMGERLMINVLSAEDAPGPWPGHMPAPGPSSSTAAASPVRAIMAVLVVPVALALAGLL